MLEHCSRRVLRICTRVFKVIFIMMRASAVLAALFALLGALTAHAAEDVAALEEALMADDACLADSSACALRALQVKKPAIEDEEGQYPDYSSDYDSRRRYSYSSYNSYDDARRRSYYSSYDDSRRRYDDLRRRYGTGSGSGCMSWCSERHCSDSPASCGNCDVCKYKSSNPGGLPDCPGYCSRSTRQSAPTSCGKCSFCSGEGLGCSSYCSASMCEIASCMGCSFCNPYR